MSTVTEITQADPDSVRLIVCPKCGAEYPAYMTFCPLCLEDMSFEDILDPQRMLDLIEREERMVEEYERERARRSFGGGLDPFSRVDDFIFSGAKSLVKPGA